MRKHSDGSSIYKGVSWDRFADKWRAQILVNRKVKTLGRYLSEREAAETYNAAAADIVKQGIVDKTNARLGYQTVLTKPLGRVTPPKTL